ncbi:TrbC/VirB2 family protein [Sulfurospirillum sp. T05]|uniref:TrbC/VirB2 family protein n=1 Tax=Sulfurospirillum tamanense TaxID=2813362 RepID=A0ABS2WUI8_9BACT|nr:TrbC/VirB2 family protein [Sulfurospirillum tamanensis]
MEAFTRAISNIHALLTDVIIAGIAGLLIAACGFVIAFGDSEKGKKWGWGIVFGISLVYGSVSIANFIWN